MSFTDETIETESLTSREIHSSRKNCYSIVVGNNSLWGIDYQIQKGIYGRTVWTELEPTRYDLVASGMGAKSKNVANFSELKSSLSEALNFNGVSLLNIEVDKVGSPVAEAAISRKFGSHS